MNIKTYEIRSIKSVTPIAQTKITSATDAVDILRKLYSDSIDVYESFYILLLNRNNKVLGYKLIGQGGVVGTVADVKLVCKYVVDTLASAVILAHNHPSGTLSPSDEDKKITAKIKQALSYFDTSVLDHIILTDEGYYSFTDNGIL
jgi:DNA repair protein RadC